jgi:hypothetical protein
LLIFMLLNEGRHATEDDWELNNESTVTYAVYVEHATAQHCSMMGVLYNVCSILVCCQSKNVKLKMKRV